MSKKSFLNSVLNTDLSKVKIEDKYSLIDDFPNKEKITEITELRLMQIILSRKALIEKTGYLGELIQDGEFVIGNGKDSKWEIYKLNDGSIRIGILWSHFDDDSWSVFFKEDNLEIDHLYYEN